MKAATVVFRPQGVLRRNQIRVLACCYLPGETATTKTTKRSTTAQHPPRFFATLHPTDDSTSTSTTSTTSNASNASSATTPQAPHNANANAGVFVIPPKDKSDDDEEINEAVKADGLKKTKPWMWDLGIPSLLPEWKKMFNKDTLVTDISAGLTVGCVAIPLNLAIAMASHVPAEVGLVTAAISGVAAGFMGGTTLAVTGPAAAISLLVVNAVNTHGLEALPLITLACGGLQLASGITRIGVAAKLVPVSVIAGFTVGVGTMILTGQVPKALGLATPPGLSPIEAMQFIGDNVALIHPSAAILAGGTAAGMYFLPKLIHPKIPAALLAVGSATVATHTFGLDVSVIGQIPHGLQAFHFGLPSMPPMDELPSLGTTIFLIYAMTSAESLLSCVALDKMKKTNYKHNPDQELVGQGLANVGSACFLGMPVTSVIARSTLNVRLNAATRLPAIVQSGFVFSSIVFFSQTIAMVPMPALSGMLIMTGVAMLNPAEFKHCYAVQKLDTLPFLTTIGGMISLGLAEGIGIGCLSAWALNYDYGRLQFRQVQLEHKADGSVVDEEAATTTTAQVVQQVPATSSPLTATAITTTAFHLNGPINFNSMFEIDKLIHQIRDWKKATAMTKEQEEQNPIVLNMRGVTSVEFTGVEELVNRLHELADDTHMSIQMYNCNAELRNALDLCDPKQRIDASCEVTSLEAPYHFPQFEEDAPKISKVPLWYDSPHFIPDTSVVHDQEEQQESNNNNSNEEDVFDPATRKEPLGFR